MRVSWPECATHKNDLWLQLYQYYHLNIKQCKWRNLYRTILTSSSMQSLADDETATFCWWWPPSHDNVGNGAFCWLISFGTNRIFIRKTVRIHPLHNKLLWLLWFYWTINACVRNTKGEQSAPSTDSSISFSWEMLHNIVFGAHLEFYNLFQCTHPTPTPGLLLASV